MFALSKQLQTSLLPRFANAAGPTTLVDRFARFASALNERHLPGRWAPREPHAAAPEGAWYRELMQPLPDVLWTATPCRKTVYVSPNAESLVGFSAEEIVREGRAFWPRHIHPEDEPKA